MSVVELRILHLEDEPLDSELAEETLREGGIAAQLERVDTLEALRTALARQRYSLVLCDYTIPGTDPLEALRYVQQTQPGLPFVFLSGTIGEERATHAMKMGASDYVLKQRMAQLPQVVRRALGEAQEAARRKQAEESLKRSEERLRLSQEVAELGSFEWDLRSGRNDWSPQMELLHGLAPGTFPGTLDAWLQFVHPEDRDQVRRLVDDALREGQFKGEWRIQRVDGKTCWLAGRGQVFRDDSGVASRMVGASIDITERKRAEEELRTAITSAERAKVAAEEATRAKDHFLAILSHELRTPLTAVIPALESMQSLVSGECLQHLEMASRNVQLEARLIDDLLDITRIVRGKVQLNRENVDLCTVVQWAAEVCQADLKAHGQHFAIRLEDSPHMVSGDPSRLQQVIWNLIQNAVKFTPTGGCIGVRARKLDGNSVVEVHDSGVGIEPEALGRIFNAFEQEAKSTTRKFGGLGLGLAISKALADLHAGRLRATSKGKNRGASFYLEIPLLPQHASTISAPSRPRMAANARNLRILLVEDHVDTARIISMVLRKAGHRVTHAADVAAGLRLGTENEYDLLLSDLGLPDASGLDLLRQLREQGVTMPGIAFSGYAQDDDVRRSRMAGFSEHLAKPVSAERLLEMVADVYSRSPEPVSDTGTSSH